MRLLLQIENDEMFHPADFFRAWADIVTAGARMAGQCWEEPALRGQIAYEEDKFYGRPAFSRPPSTPEDRAASRKEIEGMRNYLAMLRDANGDWAPMTTGKLRFGPTPWTCSFCGGENEMFRSQCQHCNREPRQTLTDGTQIYPEHRSIIKEGPRVGHQEGYVVLVDEARARASCDLCGAPIGT